jgi:Leucine-rich repeat (LRR) protein
MSQLESLNLFGNRLRELPISVLALHNLRLLNLSHNPMSELPAGIGNLGRLDTLRLPRMSRLPPDFAKLPITELYIVARGPLVSPVCSLTELRRLVCFGSLELSPDIGRLRTLELLDLSNCGVTELPEEIGQLDQLRCLYLHGNQIRSLPRSLAQLSRLERLSVDQNPLPQSEIDATAALVPCKLE